MRSFRFHVGALGLFVALPCLAQYEWELGGGVGYGFGIENTITQGAAKAKASFAPGIAFSVFGDQNRYKHVSGEMRYTQRFSDLKLSSGGQEARFGGMQHDIHYDILVYPGSREAVVKPFIAGGGGVRVFRGTGVERATQPLINFAALTKTSQVEPLISVGAGLKFEISPRIYLRTEFRDYVGPFPDRVIAPMRGASVSGWVHDLVPMLSISFGF